MSGVGPKLLRTYYNEAGNLVLEWDDYTSVVPRNDDESRAKYTAGLVRIYVILGFIFLPLFGGFFTSIARTTWHNLHQPVNVTATAEATQAFLEYTSLRQKLISARQLGLDPTDDTRFLGTISECKTAYQRIVSEIGLMEKRGVFPKNGNITIEFVDHGRLVGLAPRSLAPVQMRRI